MLFAQFILEISCLLSKNLDQTLSTKPKLFVKLNQVLSIKTMPPKENRKRLTRVRFGEFFSNAEKPYTPIPVSSPAWSNVSKTLTNISQVSSFDNLIGKVLEKNLMASIPANMFFLREIRDCILNNNEDRLKQVNPYILFYWREIHVRLVCVWTKRALSQLLCGKHS